MNYCGRFWITTSPPQVLWSRQRCGSLISLPLKHFLPELDAMAKFSRLSTVAPLLLRRRLSVLPKRNYGSAALAQVDYDYYDYVEEEEEVYRRSARPKSEECVSGRGVHWVIIGEPGAKKHVYAERLSNLLQVPHISIGTLVRQELSPRSSLYKQIANAVNQGKLVPEDIIFGLLSKRLEEGYVRGESGFILDGIPRTRIQAEILDQIADIDLVVNFKCTGDFLVRNHPQGGSSSHHRAYCRMSHPGSYLNLPSQDDQLNSAASDTELPLKQKLQIYAEQSKPLEDYYKKQRKLLDFEVAGAPGETWRGLLAALHLQHVNAVNSSQKLTI